jgi:hypothetical protein
MQLERISVYKCLLRNRGRVQTALFLSTQANDWVNSRGVKGPEALSRARHLLVTPNSTITKTYTSCRIYGSLETNFFARFAGCHIFVCTKARICARKAHDITLPACDIEWLSRSPFCELSRSTVGCEHALTPTTHNSYCSIINYCCLFKNYLISYFTEMGRTCGTYGEEERCIQGFSGET